MYARTPKIIRKAFPKRVPISLTKSSWSPPRSKPNEKPLTLIVSNLLEIDVSSSLNSTSMRGCSIKAPSLPPNSSAIFALSIVIIAKPAVEVVASES